MKTYFEHINDGIRTTLGGLKLTFRHLWQARNRRSNHNVGSSGYFNEQDGMVTLQYPLEVMPIPDNGRYRLHNEMDDCIVCDKCAKVCPVDCIDIEPIKATGEVGKASDGSPIRLYAAKFDIDMAKCCYCGLCTTVCPTECLTMTKTFDYSEFDVRDMNYHYSNLTPEQADEKKSLYEQFVREKEELKKQKAVISASAVDSPQTTEEKSNATAPIGGTGARPKPAFAPKKPVVQPSAESVEQSVDSPQTTEEKSDESAPIGGTGARPKPVFAPKKPISNTESTVDSPQTTEEKSDESAPIGGTGASPQTTEEKPDATAPIGGTGARPKPVFVPKKPKQE